MKLATQSPAALKKMEEIQSEMLMMCKPTHYNEFYKVTTERGFIRITVPRKKS